MKEQAYDRLYPNIKHLLLLSPFYVRFTDDELKMHVRWYWDHGTLSWAEDWRDRILGVCLVRIFGDIKDLDEFYIHVPDGKYLYIEYLCAVGPNATAAVQKQLYDRWSPREVIMWDRPDRTEKGAPRMYTLEKYMEIVRRMSSQTRKAGLK